MQKCVTVASDILNECRTKDKDMGLGMRQQDALRNLRKNLEEDADEDYPQDVLTELLVLYDVGKALDLTYFEIEHVLGAEGLQAVNNHLYTIVTIEEAA